MLTNRNEVPYQGYAETIKSWLNKCCPEIYSRLFNLFKKYLPHAKDGANHDQMRLANEIGINANLIVVNV